MPDSIRQRILDELETTLAAVSGVAAVERKSQVVQTVREFPTIFMLEPRESMVQQPAGYITFTMQLTLECWIIDDLAETNADVNTFLKDVANALLADYTRGGLAIDTALSGDEAFVSQTNRQAGVFLDVIVRYRTAVTDVTSATYSGF